MPAGPATASKSAPSNRPSAWAFAAIGFAASPSRAAAAARSYWARRAHPARRGYDATKIGDIDQIAHECGLAKGHSYHYFLSKEENFTEIRIDAVDRTGPPDHDGQGYPE